MKYLSIVCFRRWACEPDIPVCRMGTRSTSWWRAEDLHWRYSRSRALASTQSLGLPIENTEVSSHSISGSYILYLILYVLCFSNFWLVMILKNLYTCVMVEIKTGFCIQVVFIFIRLQLFYARNKKLRIFNYFKIKILVCQV